MEKVKNYLILTLGLIVLVLFLMKCNNIAPDPIYIKGKDSIAWDTIKRPYKVIEFKTKYYPKWDTAYVDTTDTFPIFNTPITRIYNDSSNTDSNITVYSHTKVLGVIKEQKLSYKLNLTFEIHKTISRTDTLIKVPNVSLYGGLSVSGNNTYMDIKPYVSLNYKGKNVFVSYGIYKKDIQLGIGLPLYKSKQ